MITHTSDIRKVGLLRRFSKSDKVLPSVQYNVMVDGPEGKLIIIDFSKGSPRVRLLLETLSVIAMGKIDESYLLEIMSNDGFLYMDNSYLADKIKEVRTHRVEEDLETTSTISLSTQDMGKLVTILSTNGCTLFSQGIIIDKVHRRHIDGIDIEYFQEIWGETFEKMLKGISNKEECIGNVGRTYFYPEDIYFGSEYHRLESLNRMSGNQYTGYQPLRESYYISDHFRNNPDLFTDTHCACGSDLVIRIKDGEYTVMQCLNPYCYEKLSHSLADFARAMGVDGLGATTIHNAIKYVALSQLNAEGDINIDYRKVLNDSIVNIFAPSAAEKWLDFLRALKEYNGTLKELVVNMSLPYLGDEASKVMHYDLLANPKAGPKEIAEQASYIGKKDLKFSMNLWFYLDTVRYVAFDLAKDTHLEPVNEYIIYITNGVVLQLDDGSTINYTKKQFIDLINSALRNVGETSIKIKLSSSLTYKCNALIADKGRETGSCATAESYNIPIYTSREFLKSLGGVSSGKG